MFKLIRKIINSSKFEETPTSLNNALKILSSKHKFKGSITTTTQSQWIEATEGIFPVDANFDCGQGCITVYIEEAIFGGWRI